MNETLINVLLLFANATLFWLWTSAWYQQYTAGGRLEAENAQLRNIIAAGRTENGDLQAAVAHLRLKIKSKWPVADGVRL